MSRPNKRIQTFFPTLLALTLATMGACGGLGAPSRSSGHGMAKSAPAPTSAEAGSSTADSRASSSGSSSGDAEAIAEHGVEERPGLGTRFGEERYSSVQKRRFERSSTRPFAQVALHYNSLAGIERQSWYRGTSLHELRAQTRRGGLSVTLLDERGRILRGGTGGGRTYVVGQDGQRYVMQIRNDTGGTYEVVSSVDGLDVIDGEIANLGKRGYIIRPYSTLTIDGFRTSHTTVAAFRFGAVSESYAARTSGDRNVGVIGFAFFAERGSRWTNDEIRRRETANPFPGEFARPPGAAMRR